MCHLSCEHRYFTSSPEESNVNHRSDVSHNVVFIYLFSNCDEAFSIEAGTSHLQTYTFTSEFEWNYYRFNSKRVVAHPYAHDLTVFPAW